MEKTKRIRIDFTKVSEVEKRLLAEACIRDMEKFYAIPENLRAFEEWQKERNNEKKQ